MPDLAICAGDLAGVDVGREDVAEGGVLVAGDDDRQAGARGGEQPAGLGVALVDGRVEHGDQLVEVLVPEAALAVGRGALPHGHHDLLDRAERLVLGDGGVRHAAHALLQDDGVVVLGQVAVLGEVLVAVVRDQAEQRLLQVGARHGQAVDQALANGRGQRQAQLRGRHGARHGPEHLPAAFDVAPVRHRRRLQRAGVEVLVVRQDEIERGEVVRHGGSKRRAARVTRAGGRGRPGPPTSAAPTRTHRPWRSRTSWKSDTLRDLGRVVHNAR